jgi:hypothetical protein
MICNNCKKNTDSIKSIVSKSEILTGCPNCLPGQLQMGSGTNAQYYKREQQNKFRRELTQPTEPREFIKAYPERAQQMYGEKTLRKYS